MYLLGHIGVTIFVFFLFQKIIDTDYSEFSIFIGIGSMLPDLIDKPIGSIFFGTGRWFGHSIVFLTLIFSTTFILLQEQRFRGMRIGDILKIFYIGSIAHILEDGPGISLNVVFWPLTGSIPQGSQGDFLHGFEDNFTVFFEILGFILLVFVGLTDDWSTKQWKFLILLIICYMTSFITAYSLIIGY